METVLKNSDKLILGLSKSKHTKSSLAKELGITRPTLDSRIKSNSFLSHEIAILKSLGLI